MRQFFILFSAFVIGGSNSTNDMGGRYRLISDDPALQRVTLEIEGKRVSGKGPWNRYCRSITRSNTGSNGIQIGPLASTKMACPHLSAKHIYFQELQRGSGVTIMHDGLIIKNNSQFQIDL